MEGQVDEIIWSEDRSIRVQLCRAQRAVHKLFASQQNYTNLDIELEEPEVGNGDKKNLCVEWPFHLLSCSPHNELIWNER